MPNAGTFPSTSVRYVCVLKGKDPAQVVRTGRGAGVGKEQRRRAGAARAGVREGAFERRCSSRRSFPQLQVVRQGRSLSRLSLFVSPFSLHWKTLFSFSGFRPGPRQYFMSPSWLVNNTLRVDNVPRNGEISHENFTTNDTFAAGGPSAKRKGKKRASHGQATDIKKGIQKQKASGVNARAPRLLDCLVVWLGAPPASLRSRRKKRHPRRTQKMDKGANRTLEASRI